MSDRFDDEAMRLWVLARHEDWRIEDAPAWREEWEPTAAALRSTSEEAERRGELKGLEWCLENIAEVLPSSRRQDMIADRIAELKKGGA
jgi:hypothetical protein